MKKTVIAVAVVTAGFATLTQAAPKDDSWYTGAKLGWSQYHDTNFYGNKFPPLPADVSADKNQLAAGAFAGYQVSPYLGFELGYDWLGRMPYKGVTSNAAFKAQGVQVTAKIGYPIGDAFDIYTRLGALAWRADSKYNNGLIQNRENDTGVSPVFAGGVEWAVTPNIATRLEYQWISNIGDANTVGTRPDNGQLSVGVSYRFGQSTPQPVPVAAPAPVPEPVVQTRKFTLRSDVLFNFNKSTLKPEGQQELDNLYSELSNIDPNDGSVTVLGYTDRIGSDAYNQKLSEQRAQSVQQYLVQKGIPASKVSAQGMGKADPVTGTQCDAVKNRQQLIVCLAPDRRVQIEVNGVKEVTSQPQS